MSGDEFIRAHELPERFPILGRSTWWALMANGSIPSRKLGRARIVRVADVLAFLADGTPILADGKSPMEPVTNGANCPCCRVAHGDWETGFMKQVEEDHAKEERHYEHEADRHRRTLARVQGEKLLIQHHRAEERQHLRNEISRLKAEACGIIRAFAEEHLVGTDAEDLLPEERRALAFLEVHDKETL